jgi:hypothetical protein
MDKALPYPTRPSERTVEATRSARRVRRRRFTALAAPLAVALAAAPFLALPAHDASRAPSGGASPAPAVVIVSNGRWQVYSGPVKG